MLSRKAVEATNQTKVGCQAVIVYIKNAPEAVQIALSRLDFIIKTCLVIRTALNRRGSFYLTLGCDSLENLANDSCVVLEGHLELLVVRHCRSLLDCGCAAALACINISFSALLQRGSLSMRP
jgi:hypothetical protein